VEKLFEVSVGQILADDEGLARNGACAEEEHDVWVVDFASVVRGKQPHDEVRGTE
jgi:hypothetical protein